MKTLDEILKQNAKALYFGNRVLLPFKAHLLKVIFENEIIMDFSLSKFGATYNINDEFTEIYFHGVRDVEEKCSKYRDIRLILVEIGKDIFDFGNHRKLSLYLEGNHELTIKEINGDILFFE